MKMNAFNERLYFCVLMRFTDFILVKYENHWNNMNILKSIERAKKNQKVVFFYIE